MIVENFPNRTITIKDITYLYFGGTSYLGMATQPIFQESLFKNIQKWGTFYGSSRNSNIKLAVYEEFEQFFAKQHHFEASLSVSSGTLAGKLVLDYLSKSISAFYHYPKTHPSVVAKDSLPLFIDGKLHPKLINDTVEEIVITVDAILSMEVTPTSFDFLKKISPSKKITLIVDESHSLGILGKYGKGIFNTISTDKLYRKIFISSLGKALGLTGGIIAGNREFIGLLKLETSFITSSGASPAYLETYMQTQDLYKRQFEKLQANLKFIFAELPSNSALKFDKNYPVIYSNNTILFSTLIQHYIVMTHFNYPTENDTVNRIVITANHTLKDLKKLILTINKYIS